jgi:hypothetical protein
MSDAEPQAAVPKPTRRWIAVTPGRLVVGLVVVECLLWLSERFGWPPWHKGYAVLTTVMAVGAALAALLLWWLVALLYRWPFQFSIRSLLVLVVAVALPCSWLGVEMKNARQQSESEEAVRELAGNAVTRELTVAYDYERDTAWLYKKLAARPGPKWLCAALGDDFFRQTEFVDLGTIRTSVHDASLPVLRNFSRLRVLFIGGPGITDAGLDYLGGLNRLELLGIVNSNITDSGVARIAELRLPSLRCLALVQVQVTDAAIESLAPLTGLTALSLTGTKIDDRGLERLKVLPRLENLDLCYTLVTDAGLKRLAELPNLKQLSLDGTKVSNAGLKILAALPKLDSLSLADTRVTGAGLEYLAASPSLESLCVSWESVSDDALTSLAKLKRLRELKVPRATAADAAKLRAALPNCKIER